MLTLTHPKFLAEALNFPGGLHAADIGDRIVLILKAGKEWLLTAKINRGFKVYVCPLDDGGVGLITAFFDDEDEPLVWMTLLDDSEDGRRLLTLLLSDRFDTNLFDEHNRELLGYTCKTSAPAATRSQLAEARLLTVNIPASKQQLLSMTQWFGLRTAVDDAAAINVQFVEPLVPENLFVQDARADFHAFHGSDDHSYTSLVREEPGVYQEQDIIRLFQHFFPPSQIFHGPLRVSDRKEIADILVFTDTYVIAVQAKDSPNIERILRNTIARKRKSTHSSLDKALRQVKGAASYLRSVDPIRMLVRGEEISIPLDDRILVGLVVLKEMFNDEYEAYTDAILGMTRVSHVACIALDYPELVSYAAFLQGEEAFFGAYWRVFKHGWEHGTFPRLRMVPPTSK